MNGAETGSRRGEAGRAAAMNSAEQTVTWLITLGVLESPKKTISDPEGFLQASLKDGVVLCRLLERLLPGTIEKVSVPGPTPPRRTGPGGGSPRRWEAPRPASPAMRRDARVPGRSRRHLVAARGWESAGRGGAHASPLCADPGTRPARGARWRREDPVAGVRGAIVCGVGWERGSRPRTRGTTPGRPEGKGSAVHRPEVESPLSVTRPENRAPATRTASSEALFERLLLVVLYESSVPHLIDQLLCIF